MSITWALVPSPEYIATDEQARELLDLALLKLEEDPDDFFGYDTETHGKKIPVKGGPLDWMSDTILFWSLSFVIDGKPRRWCISQEHLHFFAELLENPKAILVIWNAKYDGHVSWNSGINIWNAKVIDILALSHLLDENRREHDLKTCAADYCGLHMTKYKDLFGEIDAEGNKIKEYETSLLDLVHKGMQDKVSDYASYDAYAHLMTAYYYKEQLELVPIDEHKNLWTYFLSMEQDITEVLWRMERRGMPVDTPYLESQLPIIQKEIHKVEKIINRTAGRPININSPQQLREFLFGPEEDGNLGLAPIKMTKGGANAPPQPSTDKDVMKILEETGVTMAKHVVRCRSLIKTKSTYLEALVNLSNHFEDGRIHPSFNQFGARTGRFSAKNPNSQNFPRPDNDEWNIRRAFIARPGHRLIVSDYEQLEMRIMAHLSEDENMIQAILDGKDLHSFTVAEMDSSIRYEDVVAAKKTDNPTAAQKILKTFRQDYKGVGFGIIYGAGPQTIATTITISDADVEQRIYELGQELTRRVKRKMAKNPLLTVDDARIKVARESIAAHKIEAYFNVFPRVKQYLDDIPNLCAWRQNHDIFDEPEPKRWGFVQTLLGRYRRLEDITHNNYAFRGHAEREAVNSTIQGSAADIVKGAMLRIEFSQSLNFLGVWMLNQIHDELVCEVLEENVEEAAPIIKDYMEHPFGDGKEAMGVPIPVDLKIVANWAMAK